MTLVCVPIMVEDADAAWRDAAEARRLGAALVEFRIDSFFAGETDRADAVCRLVDTSPAPCIVTCRSADEGGSYRGDDVPRAELYQRLSELPNPPRYVDFELSAWRRSPTARDILSRCVNANSDATDNRPGLILSAHDFNGRPPNLLSIVEAMRNEPLAAVHKVAYRCRSLRDNLELFELLLHRQRPMIALGMGEFGLLSRVLAPKFGALLTFASLRESSATAPGQPTIAELLNRYRFGSIGPATRVYGVIGWPLAQSKSPTVHNAGFENAGRDAVYLPLPIPPEWEHLKATLHALLDFSPLHFSGASVTIPHKEHLVRFAREDRTRTWELDTLSARCGAANTLLMRTDGSCAVSNTDGPAAVESLQTHTGGTGSLAARRVGVLGAGGAARAISAALADAGATVVVFARRRAQAEALVAELMHPPTANDAASGRIVAGEWGKLCGSCLDAVVNCTPAGMTGGPDPDSSPVSADELGNMKAGSPVLDTVYKPLETPLLRAAGQSGMTPVSGLEMFILQAAMQMKTWLDEGQGTPATLGAITGQYRRTLQKSLASDPES